MSTYDVLIVGAGPSGASAAVHLAQRGARVAVAERERFPRAKLCGEFISPECLAHFARLGVLDAMSRESGASRVSETVFYASSGRSVCVPSAWFGESDALGLSRAEMDRRLLQRAREAGAEVFEGAQASGLLFDEAGRVVGARFNREGETFEARARLTLDATGRAHALSRLVERERDGQEASRGAKAVRREAKRGDFARRAPLVAFKAHLEGARASASACEIYFYRGGYGGLSPVENGLSNLCFIARAADARACGSDPARVMREILMRNSRARASLKEARAATPWLSVALEGFGRRELSPSRGLLAIGDAASFIDPFTGSGMLMALESGELAAEETARWLEKYGPDDVRADVFDELSRAYMERYEARFGARLRLCARLRRAAFAPGLFAEAAIFALRASASARRSLARATRRRAVENERGSKASASSARSAKL